jgi:hypothetical protein
MLVLLTIFLVPGAVEPQKAFGSRDLPNIEAPMSTYSTPNAPDIAGR